MAYTKPIIVLVPGASQTPSHYAYFLHILQSQGYATLSALLPSTGDYAPITAENDADWIRSRLLHSELDVENHDVVLLTHSYSSVPGSAAARGLGKATRATQGKKTSVVGQIFISGLVVKGGDGKDITAMFGGQMPPHIVVDKENNMVRCPDPKPPLYNDVPNALADVAVAECMNPCLSSWTSPCPRASWDEKDFEGRIAYIRTKNDQSVPYDIQNVMIDASGQKWILRDLDSGHSPNLSMPERLAETVIELVKGFEGM